jgi:hypothetical protein
MRTAEEILAPKGYFVKHNVRCYEYDDVVRIINEVKKETAEEVAKKAFYKGFEKCEKDDANCFTAWREEAANILSPISELKYKT